MNSKLYCGKVSHTRFEPMKHRFEYSTFMCFLDIDELPTLFDIHPLWSFKKSNLAWFNPDNYIGKNSDIRTAVAEHIFRQTGVKFNGRICVLTNLTYFGYCFNPVSFYYCYNEQNSLQFIVSEINNTPWNERHVYVTQVSNRDSFIEHNFNKSFHVSPFLDMDFEYQWKFNHPDEQLIINMDNFKQDSRWFNAHMNLEAMPVTSKNLSLVLRNYPFMTLKVIAAIYWQALKIKLKGVPFYDHPNPAS